MVFFLPNIGRKFYVALSNVGVIYVTKSHYMHNKFEIRFLNIFF